MPVPDVVRHGVSDSQIKSAAEKVTTILNKLLGGFLRPFGSDSRRACFSVKGVV